MTEDLEFFIETWLSDDLHCAEESATMAALKMTVGQVVATRVEDLRAKTIRDVLHVSAYPLALWLASNWWRLRWEPQPFNNPNPDWRMSHVMSAVGGGYVWPPVMFHGDGNGVNVEMTPAHSSPESDLRFIENTRTYVSGRSFEFAVSDFIERVLDRLSQTQVSGTELHHAWHAVTTERQEPELFWRRKLEASLGFDPEEGDEQLLLALTNIASDLGEGVATELTAAEREHAPAAADRLKKMLEEAETWKPSANIIDKDAIVLGNERPHEIGYRKAIQFRQKLGKHISPISDSELADIFGFQPEMLDDVTHSSFIGVSERIGETNHLLLTAKNNLSRRFEVSRLAGDRLFVESDDRWSLATRSHTARQKFQRAFAAEFLSPVRGIKARISPGATSEEIGEVAADFGVSPLTIQHQMVNAGMLPAETLWQN